MLMMSFVSIALVTVVWLLVGYSLAFGNDAGAGLIGDLSHIGMAAASARAASHGHRPHAALRDLPAHLRDHHRGADQRGDRRPRAVRRRGWSSSPCGRCSSTFRSRTGCGARRLVWRTSDALDFAGGTVGRDQLRRSALALRLVLGPRLGFKRDAMRPHNLPLCCSAPACSGSAGSASTPAPRWAPTVWPPRPSSTRLGRGCPALLGWLFVEQLQRRPPDDARRGVRRGRRPGRDHRRACGSVSPLGRAGRRPGRRRASARTPSG